MDRFEAYHILPAEEERRFFMGSTGSVWVDLREVSDNPQHMQIAAALQNNGFFPEGEIKGGYCLPRNAREGVIYWGPTAGQLPAANQAEFDHRVDTQGIEIFNSHDVIA